MKKPEAIKILTDAGIDYPKGLHHSRVISLAKQVKLQYKAPDRKWVYNSEGGGLVAISNIPIETNAMTIEKRKVVLAGDIAKFEMAQTIEKEIPPKHTEKARPKIVKADPKPRNAVDIEVPNPDNDLILKLNELKAAAAPYKRGAEFNKMLDKFYIVYLK